MSNAVFEIQEDLIMTEIITAVKRELNNWRALENKWLNRCGDIWSLMLTVVYNKNQWYMKRTWEGIFCVLVLYQSFFFFFLLFPMDVNMQWWAVCQIDHPQFHVECKMHQSWLLATRDISSRTKSGECCADFNSLPVSVQLTRMKFFFFYSEYVIITVHLFKHNTF